MTFSPGFYIVAWTLSDAPTIRIHGPFEKLEAKERYRVMRGQGVFGSMLGHMETLDEVRDAVRVGLDDLFDVEAPTPIGWLPPALLILAGRAELEGPAEGADELQPQAPQRDERPDDGAPGGDLRQVPGGVGPVGRQGGS